MVAGTCIACERGQGPFSLHHYDDDGCMGTFGGATFTLEPHPDPDNHSLLVRRIEPVTCPAPVAPYPSSGEPGANQEAAVRAN